MNLFDRIERARASFSTLTASASDAATRMEETAARIEAAADRASTATDRAIGDLTYYVEKYGTDWAPILQDAIDLLETGGMRGEEFVARFGDYVVQTETGTTRIRELLDGIDFRQYDREVQDLILRLRTGGAELGEALDLLRERGGKLTATFLAAVEAFQRGQGSLERILLTIEQLKETTGGQTTLDDLLETIAGELGEGVREGNYG